MLYKVRVESAARDNGRAIATALAELIEPAAQAVSEFAVGGGWHIEAYYNQRPDLVQLSARIAELLAICPPTLSLEQVADQNWVALSQTALPPVAAGRYIVHGSHDRTSVPRGPRSIEIDAGEAFGTAHHATTLSCLMTIDRLARTRAFQQVLDLGCGSGVLAIAAQRAWPRARVTALDNDPTAVAVAAANCRQNGVSRIAVRLASDSGPPLAACRTYELVLANILARPLIALAPAIARALAPGGILVISGILAGEARELRAAYAARGFRLASESCMAGWTTLTLVRVPLRTRPKSARRVGPWPAPRPARSRVRAGARRSG